MRKRKEMDLLSGSIVDKLLIFAIPLAVTGIMQQLFNAMDVMVVGRFASKEAMAAVGSNTPIVGLMVNLFVGISLGANVTIARYIGQERPKDVKKAVHTAIIISLVSGVIMAVIGILISAPLLGLMGVPAEVLPMSLKYLRIYLLGMPVVLLYNFESAIFRSCGDTRTPLICLMMAGVLNVILNILFVVGFHRDADGVAMATVISNLASSAVMFVLLCRTDKVIGVDPKAFRVDPHVFRVILRIGIPAGLQACVFSLSNIIIQSAINSLGADVMAASSAAFNVEIFAYFIVNAFGQACTTFIGQNNGAGNKERCKKITRYAFLLDMTFTLVISAIILIFAENILFFFNEDANVIYYGLMRVRYITIFQFVNATMEIISGTLRGYGNSLAPAIITFIGVCGTRIIWVYTAFPIKPEFRTLLTCYPISWIITAILLVSYYFYYRNKREKSPL